ncbi:MAG TPA: DegV family protein [Dehalococcoidia bacterium]|jgi:DegV family protein with EDD domain|nr:DegV family protein [Dehalococcoidia bacterium]
MIGTTVVVIDSSAYLPRSLVERYGLLVAPLSVVLDGRAYEEGVDITPDEFYERVASAQSVSTSQPSVGRLIELYREAAEGGAEEVLSIHIGANISGTVQSAQLASESSPVPVTVVDTAQASFAEGLCVWEAIDALAAGKSVADAAALARAAAKAVGNTFVVKALELARRGGRLAAGEEAPAGIPVLALTGEGMKVIGNATTMEEAVGAMAGHVETAVREATGRKLRVGVGHGAAPEIAAALHERIARIDGIQEIVDYVVGPVIGAHTGAGTAGAVFLARPVLI